MTPDRATPDRATPDRATPDRATPDGTTPDRATPDGTTPDGTTPDGTTPDRATPDRATPDRTTPVRATSNRARGGRARGGHAPPGPARGDRAEGDRTSAGGGAAGADDRPPTRADGRPPTRPAPWRRVFYGWWMVAALAVTELVSWGVLVYAFSVFVVPMRAELGWSTAQLNGAYTTGIAVSGLVAIPVGRWLQRRGARGVMTAGSLLGVAALLAWAHTSSLGTFYAAFVLAGLAMAGTLYEPAFAVTAAWFVRHRARAVLVLTVAGGLSSTVFVPLTGLLIGAYGWRTTLLVLAGIMGLVAVPLHAGLLRRWPSDLGTHPDGSPPETAPPAHRDIVRGKITRRASYRWFTLHMVGHTAGKLAVTVILVAYLTERGYTLPQATLAAGAVGAFQVLGRLILTALQPRLPVQRTATLLFAAQAIALPVPLLTAGDGPAATASVIVMVVFFGLGYGLPDLLRGTLLVDYYGPYQYPRINGTLSIFVVAARAAGPLLAALAATAFGGHAATLAAAALLVALSAYALHRAARAHTAERHQMGEGI